MFTGIPVASNALACAHLAAAHDLSKASEKAAENLSKAHKEAAETAAREVSKAHVEASREVANSLVEAAKSVALAYVVATVINTAPSWDGLILFFVAIGLLFVSRWTAVLHFIIPQWARTYGWEGNTNHLGSS